MTTKQAETIGKVIGVILLIFILPAFFMWGWNSSVAQVLGVSEIDYVQSAWAGLMLITIGIYLGIRK